VVLGQTTPAATDTTNTNSGTEADKIRSIYKSAGEAQNHNFGDNPPGSKPVDLTKIGGGEGKAAPAGRVPTAAGAPQGVPTPAAAPGPGGRNR